MSEPTTVECPICHGSRWKSVEIDGVERVVRCDCWRASMVDGLLRDARIQPRYDRCDLATFEPDTDTRRNAYRKAMRFVDAFPVVDRGLLLRGPQGVGKTHLAVGILKEVIRTKGARGYFYETREFLRIIRDTYNRSVSETEMSVLSPVLNADLLVLDDLGAERTSEWVQETLGLVVNTRYNAKRPTVITSNLVDITDVTDPRSFTFQVGARTRSRLLEMCDWVEIPGFDRREIGTQPTAEEIARSWKSAASHSQEGAERGSKLPPKARGQARAQLRASRGDADLKWSGGKAGSR